MEKGPIPSKERKLTFSREGLIPAVAGLMCSMASDEHFSSARLSKFIQHIHGSLLSAEFSQLSYLEHTSHGKLDDEIKARLAGEYFKIHGQSLQNLVKYWKDEKYITRVSGLGRNTLYTVTERGVQHFMEQVYLCEVGLDELRVDYLLLSLYMIRSTPLAIIQEISPKQLDTWTSEEQIKVKWNWKKARDRFVQELERRQKWIADYNDTNDQLPDYLAEAKKKAESSKPAAIIGSLLVLSSAVTMPLLGYLAYRSQRDQKWHKSLRVLANMYESFRPSYIIHDIEEGIQYRSSILYAPMVQTMRQIIRTLKQLR